MAQAYRVEYTNEDSTFCVSDTMTLEQASQMVMRLYEGAWGQVSSVVVAPSDQPLDTRTIAEIEANIIT